MSLKDRKRGGDEKWGRNYEKKREIESEQENEIQMDSKEKSKTGNTQDAERTTSRKKPTVLLPLSTVAWNKKKYSEQCLNGTEPLDIIALKMHLFFV